MVPAHIKENLKKLPEKPGVYIHRDKMGQIIYVGKAISLKRRVSQYFQSSKNMDAKVKAMVGHIADFEYIVCESEMEAFILENNLIKENRPKYNILLRDDKTYPYIKVTVGEEWPRVVKTRIVDKDGSKYFGPYSDVSSVNNMVDLLGTVFRLKDCNAKKFKPGQKPCLNYHIGRCDGICAGKANRKKYMERVDQALDYLSGKNKNLEVYLKTQMEEASVNMDYERAAMYRDYYFSAKALMEKQRVVFKQNIDMDAVLSIGPEHMAIFYVREGKLSGREVFEIQSEAGEGETSRTAQFIRQYYGDQTAGPSQIIVEKEPEDQGLIEAFLSNLWGRKVSILVPQKGEKKALLELAKSNRNEIYKTMEEKDQRKKARDEAVAQELQMVIEDMDGGFKAPLDRDLRVEAYDISNTNGIDTVAAMVVFKGLKPDKKSYRRFKIRSEAHGDDYGAMQEVLYRRFKRAEEGDAGFVELPDLIILDGGKGHLGAALTIMNAMKVKVPTSGAVKDDNHRTRGLVYMKDGEPFEIPLPERQTLFSYVGVIQEEVHRFAIEYHRKLRDNKSLVSVLDSIKGIGPKKRNALLTTFGSVEKVKNASLEQLMETEGITEANAREIILFFSKNKG